LNETLAKNMTLMLENKNMALKLQNVKMDKFRQEDLVRLEQEVRQCNDLVKTKDAMILKLVGVMNTSNRKFDDLKQHSLMFLKDFVLYNDMLFLDPLSQKGVSVKDVIDLLTDVVRNEALIAHVSENAKFIFIRNKLEQLTEIVNAYEEKSDQQKKTKIGFINAHQNIDLFEMRNQLVKEGLKINKESLNYNKFAQNCGELFK